jgi:maltose O-acetyltransferase
VATEKQKMLAGLLYDASDSELEEDRLKARQLLQVFNSSDPSHKEQRLGTARRLMGRFGQGVWIEPPFYCDYGYNIFLGDKVYFNFNCVVLDVCPVNIGGGSMFGPAVQIYTATHPVDSEKRCSGAEYGKPVTIGQKVWVGGGAIIYPGVTIGERAVVGAGAVVTKDVPPAVLVGGNPAGVLREVT